MANIKKKLIKKLAIEAVDQMAFDEMVAELRKVYEKYYEKLSEKDFKEEWEFLFGEPFDKNIELGGN